MSAPSSTYRIQLHKGFTFRDLHRIIDYLHTLGVTTVYASPILQATPGSMHGYDVTDPYVINTELGDADDLRSIVKDLRKKNMYWLQDIVPNHMAFHTTNSRLMDVLERGPVSPYYRYFDIDWNHPDEDLKGKVMVPFLGNPLEVCLNDGQVKLSFDSDGFKVRYLDTAYPLSLCAYPQLILRLQRQMEDNALASGLSKMIAAAAGIGLDAWSSLKNEQLETALHDPENADALEQLVNTLNEDKAELNSLLDQQYYRLTFWKETDHRINYRRFFTVNELICLRMEDDEVFEEYHRYLFKLFNEKLIDGFRIDHIDGLQDPAKYTQELRAAIGDGPYIIAEKILEAKEDMPAQWPLQGTSGYEFLSFLNQLLTNRKGARQLLAFYKELVSDMPAYDKLIFDSKRLILENYMGGEWDNLTRLFHSSGLAAGFTHARIKSALGLFMLSLPVYRIYPDSLPLKGKNLITIHEAFDKAFREGGDQCAAELNHLRELFTTAPASETQYDQTLLFLRRLMQFTGPLTAKGVEDTTFYIYNPLISHDEVGDSPAPMGMSVHRFHERLQIRQSSTPLSLNATATHDTKRGEDARVRINVLTRIPELWKEHVLRWLDINEPFRTKAGGRTVPALNDEYFIYQSMLGGFPEDFQMTEEFTERVQAYLKKALREAKVNTSWSEPDEEYEKSCEQFIANILDPKHTFLASFVPFVKIVLEHAMIYTLTQTVIKLTAPGIPDIYQGCELWDLSFVDPDNRRPVDYEKRMGFLFQLVIREQKGNEAVLEYLREHRQEGIEKLFVTWKTLNFRKQRPELFTEGDYVPLAITGDEVKAAGYARCYKDNWALIIFQFGLARHDVAPEDSSIGQFVIIPEGAPDLWTNIFTGEVYSAGNQMFLDEIFRNFPVAFLASNYTVS